MKLLVIFTLFVSVSISAQEFVPSFEEDLTNPAVKFTLDKKGGFKEVVVLRWHDSVYTKNGHINYTFEQGFDYPKKQGFIRTYDAENKLINEDYSYKYDGIVAREELLQVFEIFKSNPSVKKILAEIKEPITLHGGFSYADKEESQPCYSGNRCVHVFASIPSNSVAAHAIVKLTDKSVPYPHFDAEMYRKK
ncbi:hypothetical protein MNBD_GAMMA02-1210 [hydrothermal vent metagenome]|uniref:Uncharacterized protein n=1 Tax=hydrothermal vent metagenome TaxID=652676 RepID=A0A3B0WL87_9ZZZZ